MCLNFSLSTHLRFDPTTQHIVVKINPAQCGKMWNFTIMYLFIFLQNFMKPTDIHRYLNISDMKKFSSESEYIMLFLLNCILCATTQIVRKVNIEPSLTIQSADF